MHAIVPYLVNVEAADTVLPYLWLLTVCLLTVGVSSLLSRDEADVLTFPLVRTKLQNSLEIFLIFLGDLFEQDVLHLYAEGEFVLV